MARDVSQPRDWPDVMSGGGAQASDILTAAQFFNATSCFRLAAELLGDRLQSGRRQKGAMEDFVAQSMMGWQRPRTPHRAPPSPH